MNPRPILHWLPGGLLLGGILLFAVATARPLGVSTQYVRAAGGLVEACSPGSTGTNRYFQEEKIVFGYSEALVAGIPLGAFLAALITRRLRARSVPEPWRSRFGPSVAIRFTAAAAAGFLLLYGARLAGGCTSGHILSGVSQLAVSSIVFFAAAFGAAAASARLIYGGREA